MGAAGAVPLRSSAGTLSLSLLVSWSLTRALALSPAGTLETRRRPRRPSVRGCCCSGCPAAPAPAPLLLAWPMVRGLGLRGGKRAECRVERSLAACCVGNGAVSPPGRRPAVI